MRDDDVVDLAARGRAKVCGTGKYQALTAHALVRLAFGVRVFEPPRTVLLECDCTVRHVGCLVEQVFTVWLANLRVASHVLLSFDIRCGMTWGCMHTQCSRKSVEQVVTS